MSENLDLNQEAGKRPTFLTVLCILSFIAAGISIIGGLIMGLGKGAVEAAGGTTAISSEMSNMPGMTSEGSEALAAVDAIFSWPYMITSMILVIIGLIGVIKMWKLKKMGFYLYTGATVVSMIMSIVYSGFGPATFGYGAGGWISYTKHTTYQINFYICCLIINHNEKLVESRLEVKVSDGI